MIQNKTFQFFLKLLTGLAIFSLIIWKVGLDEIIKNLIRFNFTYVLIVTLIHPLTFIIAAFGVIFLGRSMVQRLRKKDVILSFFIPKRCFIWKNLSFRMRHERLRLERDEKAFLSTQKLFHRLLGY